MILSNSCGYKRNSRLFLITWDNSLIRLWDMDFRPRWNCYFSVRTNSPCQSRLIVTAADKERIMQPLPPLGTVPNLDHFISGHEWSDVHVNLRGSEVLASSKIIPVAGWYAIVTLPTAEAFAPISDMQFRLLSSTLVLSLLACALAWWMLKQQFSPMLSASRALTALSDSNQAYQPLPVVSDDEVGDLITGFNNLLKSLLRQKVALQEERSRYRSLVDWSPQALVVYRGGSIIYANPASIELFGANSELEMNGKDIRELIHANGPQIDLYQTKLNLNDVMPSPIQEVKLIKMDGTVIDVEVQDIVINYDGEPATIVALHDVTERKRALENLRITASVFDISQEAIMITDANNTIIDVNMAFSRITGYSRSEVIGKNPRILNSGQQKKSFYDAMWKSIKEQKTWRGEIWNRRKSGEIYPEMLSISVLCDIDGKAIRHVAMFSDISAIKTHEAELSRVAYFDALTGIPNRLLLADRMGHAIYQAARDKSIVAVCYLDLDGFKSINDSMGHATGDQVLIEVANRIEATVRGGDTVARLGGDEFVVLLVGLEHGEECATTLERLLAAIFQPIMVNDNRCVVSASIGVSIYPLDNEDADTLLRHADQAMYVAKQIGKNRYHIYDPAMDVRARSQHEFLRSIRHALDQEQFVLYYQPKINLRTGELVGAEALIRWQHPERGLLSPGEFLKYVENTELDIEIGEWVAAKALAQMNIWQKSGLDVGVSINISGYHLESPNFTERLRQRLATYPDIPLGRLQIEVLETVALNDIFAVREIIGACRELGVSFALDDFGTGYSSLTYLSTLPVDTLKIDQSFVRDMLEDKGDMAIVQGIIVLANAFDRKIVAEGIETAGHYQALRDMECDVGQGYWIARPMPADELLSWHATFLI